MKLCAGKIKKIALMLFGACASLDIHIVKWVATEEECVWTGAEDFGSLYFLLKKIVVGMQRLRVGLKGVKISWEW